MTVNGLSLEDQWMSSQKNMADRLTRVPQVLFKCWKSMRRCEDDKNEPRVTYNLKLVPDWVDIT